MKESACVSRGVLRCGTVMRRWSRAGQLTSRERESRSTSAWIRPRTHNHTAAHHRGERWSASHAADVQRDAGGNTIARARAHVRD